MKKMKKLLSAALALLLLCLGITGCAEKFDYRTSDLSQYITLHRDQYMNQTVEIDLPPVIDDAYVDEYIRDEVLTDKGVSIYITDRNTVAGDLLGLYYRATAEIDGKETELLSNILDEKAYAYQLGGNGLDFGNEFDSALTDLDMTHQLVKRTEGKLKADHVIYATYSYSYPVGEGEEKTWKTVVQTATTRLDLAELAETQRFGAEFVTNLADKEIGKKHHIQTKFDADSDGRLDDVSFSITVKAAVEESPSVFTITYPDDHRVKTLAGKTVTFYACVNGRLGTAKELLTDGIVKDIIKYKPDGEYEGSVVDVYIQDVKELLTDSRADKVQSDAVNALWAQLRKDVKLIKYPEEAVDSYYNTLYEQAKNAYSAYNTQVGAGSLDEFIVVYYGAEEGTKHQEYFRERAQAYVLDRLIYHTVLRQEHIDATAEEIQAARPDVVAQMISSYTVQYYQAYGTWENFTEKDMVDKFGEEYIDSNVYEMLLTEKTEAFLYEHMTVKEKTDEKK